MSDDRDERAKYQFADRFALQQAWFIASELARRNRRLRITRLDGLDNNPILVVHDGPNGPRVQFDLMPD